MYTICWRAWVVQSYPTQMSGEIQVERVRNADGTIELPRRCVYIKIRRCKYCVQGADIIRRVFNKRTYAPMHHNAGEDEGVFRRYELAAAMGGK